MKNVERIVEISDTHKNKEATPALIFLVGTLGQMFVQT
jgi:hypothetical protein